MYDNWSVYSPDFRNFYCQPSSLASYHGSVMSAAKTRCQKSYCREQYVVGVAEEDRVKRQ